MVDFYHTASGVTMEVEIRPATPEDCEWAARLMARSDPWVTLDRSLDACRAVFADGRNETFIASAGVRPCGFAVLDRAGIAGAPYIRSLAVDEDMRGRRIGTRLLAFAEEHFRRNSRHLFLCVSSFNGRARALYERVGYRVVGELPELGMAGYSELLMHKRIDR
jgi:ribosomal-protein-alanine N-acetyltransferase